MSDADVDVLIVGAGPVGLATANLLGRAGVDTLLIERNASTVSEPRAVSIDDESLRCVQHMGLVDEVLPDLMSDYGSVYLDRHRRPFLKVHPTTREFGFPRRNAFRQDRLEAQLRRGLDRSANVEARFQCELGGFDQDGGGVRAQLRTQDGRSREIRARYLVATDGARSEVRRQLGIEMKGLAYAQEWLIIDLLDSRDPYRETQVYCDPDRPGINLPGPGRTRRFEFMLRPGETREQVLDDRFVRRLLSAHGPDRDAPIRRKTVYKFHALLAERWRSGRVFLAGDAAHLTPPFAGQGMNSGLRDAHNLAWKLAAVLQGEIGEGLLESYEAERRPHAWELITMAIRMGYVMMPKSRASALAVQSGFRALGVIPPAKDWVGQMKYKPKPRFKAGMFLPGKDKRSLVGRMFPQPSVELPDGRQVLLDEGLQPGFVLLAMGIDARKAFAGIANSALGALPVRHVLFTPQTIAFPRDGGEGWLRDATGALAKVMRAAGVRAVLIRPDRYVAAEFGEQDLAEGLAGVRTLLASYGTPEQAVRERELMTAA